MRGKQLPQVEKGLWNLLLLRGTGSNNAGFFYWTQEVTRGLSYKPKLYWTSKSSVLLSNALHSFQLIQHCLTTTCTVQLYLFISLFKKKVILLVTRCRVGSTTVSFFYTCTRTALLVNVCIKNKNILFRLYGKCLSIIAQLIYLYLSFSSAYLYIICAIHHNCPVLLIVYIWPCLPQLFGLVPLPLSCLDVWEQKYKEGSDS